MSEAEFEALLARRGQTQATILPRVQSPARNEPAKPDSGLRSTVEKKRAPNKTETEYARILSLEYPGAKVRYEAITLRLENGARYTPDHAVFLATGETILVEVKNAGFKHASYGRSKLAFSQAVIDFPMFKFRWAEKDKTGWTVTDY